MGSSLLTPAERARKLVQVILQALAEPGRGVAIASAMGVSESTISRAKNDHLETFCQILTHAGLKVVPVDRVCVDRQTYESLTHIATKAMANPEIARQLVWDDE